MQPGGLELVAVHAKPEKPAAEGVRGVVGDRAVRARGGDRQSLVADRHAELDVGLNLPGVKRAVEGPELDGALLENAVEVKEAVPAGIVVLVCVVGPIAVAVPKPGEFFGSGRPAAVQDGEEGGVDRAAPAAPALRADLEGLGQEVFLGVDQVNQVAQGLWGVFPKANVHVDAAGGVGVCSGRPEGPDASLHRFAVLPAANRAHELGALVAAARDAGVGNALPPPAVRRGDLPGVVRAAGVPDGRSFAEGLRDGLRGALAGNAVHFDLDAECLVFHGSAPFSRRRLFPPGPDVHFGVFPSRRVHLSLYLA